MSYIIVEPACPHIRSEQLRPGCSVSGSDELKQQLLHQEELVENEWILLSNEAEIVLAGC
jgi:hypothetical protein